MGNYAYKKQQALEHNEIRSYKKKCAEELAQDKINNPEKYKRTPRKRTNRKAQAFIATAMAISPNAFDERLLK